MRKTIKSDVHYDIGKCFVFELLIKYLFYLYWHFFFIFFFFLVWSIFYKNYKYLQYSPLPKSIVFQDKKK